MFRLACDADQAEFLGHALFLLSLHPPIFLLCPPPPPYCLNSFHEIAFQDLHRAGKSHLRACVHDLKRDASLGPLGGHLEMTFMPPSHIISKLRHLVVNLHTIQMLLIDYAI